jgi:prepilin-type N-terminal cleavage/methylation domain-containing protein
MNRHPIATRPDRHAFTLIELLTVVLIISLLVAILIPVIGKVRKAGYEAATRAQMIKISTAIEAYQADFHDYPGALSNQQLADEIGGLSPTLTYNGTAYALMNKATGAAIYPTTTENMVVALLGGYKFDVAALQFQYDHTLMGQGPQSLNASVLQAANAGLVIAGNPVKHNAYLSVSPDELSDSHTTMGTGVLSSDSAIPEFVDRFPTQVVLPVPSRGAGAFSMDAGPILYIRAKKGGNPNPGVTNGVTNPDITDGVNMSPKPLSNPGGMRNTNQYGEWAFTAYLHGSDPNSPTGIFGAKSSGYDYASSDAYFVDPSNSSQPRQKDGYWLISAGADRIFGTVDDITQFGSVGK